MSLQVFHHLHPQVCKHCGEFLLRAHQCVTPAEQRGNQHRSYSWYHACSWEYKCMQSVTHNNAGGEYSHAYVWKRQDKQWDLPLTPDQGDAKETYNQFRWINRGATEKNMYFLFLFHFEGCISFYSVSQINVEQCFLFQHPLAGQTFVIASN